jgi:hypothetical protein
MFPFFRVISDGPASGVDTFISNDSFYSGQWGGTNSSSHTNPVALPDTHMFASQVLGHQYETTEREETSPDESPSDTCNRE